MARVNEPDRPQCLVIGGGLGGLACAHGLARAGREVLVVEAGDELGGRARTSWHRGRPVDEGFQVLLRGYREVRTLAREVGLPRSDMRPVSGGAVFHRGEGWDRLAGGPAGLARFSGLPPADRLRLARLGAPLLRAPEDALTERFTDAETTEEYLREVGFAETSIDGVFRPLFGTIFLDRSLSADPGYFRFLLGALARGPASIPSDGLGMLSEWTAAAVRQLGGRIETESAAVELVPDPGRTRVSAVRLEGGRELAPSQVVLACEAPATARLLGDMDPGTRRRIPTEAASAVTAAFALSAPLYRGRAIVLDCDPPADERARVDIVCQTSNVTRPSVEEGPHILLAMRVTTGGVPAEGIEDAMGRLARRWAPLLPWDRVATHVGTFVHPFAQFRPLAGVRDELPGARTALDNLILAGDFTRHPSSEGAVGSGRHAARVVDALLP